MSLSITQRSIAIRAVYNPSDKVADVQTTNRHIASMESLISSLRNNAVAVFGDYNRPELRWVRNEDHSCLVDVAYSSLTQSNTALAEGMSANNMRQLNHMKNRFGNTLDLLFVNEELVDEFTI